MASAEATRKRRVNKLKKAVIAARAASGGTATSLWMGVNALRLTSGIDRDEIGLLAHEPPAAGGMQVPHLASDGFSITMGPEEVNLAPDQAAALQIVLTALAGGKPIVTLAGPAGTGKTTIMRVLIQKLREMGRDVVLVAPTNRAALRLQELTGVCAGTIHKLARMRPIMDEDTGELLGFAEGEEGSAEISMGTIVIIDEASMVDLALQEKLTRALPAGTQQVAVGDPCQLPPVVGSAGYPLGSPDALLTVVHRQEEGHLLDFATWLRQNRHVLRSAVITAARGQIVDASYEDLGISIARGDVPVVLVATNAVRWQVNQAARRALGFPALVMGPQVGERVIAYSTTRGSDPVANGELGVVKVVRESNKTVGGEHVWWCVVDFGGVERKLLVPSASWESKNQTRLGEPKAVTMPVSRAGAHAKVAEAQALIALQPAYALTVHKAQGAQWPGGVIILDVPHWLGEDAWRWGYTAVTRMESWVQFLRITGMRRVVIADPPADLSQVRMVGQKSPYGG